jgi:hypothetical protein
MNSELLDQLFVDHMYENMWQFMNSNTITSVMKQMGSKVKCKIIEKKIEDDVWDYEKYKGNIYFKGDIDCGHYVYVSEKKAWGSYENKILLPNDDGMCHGVSMIFAILKNPDKNVLNSIDIKLNITIPIKANTNKQYKKYRLYIRNYIIILKFYKFIIEKGYWGNALKKFFQECKSISNKSTIALKLINNKIIELQALLN